MDETGKIYSCTHNYQSIITANEEFDTLGKSQEEWYRISLDETGRIIEKHVPEFSGYTTVFHLDDGLFSLTSVDDEGKATFRLFDTKNLFVNKTLQQECNFRTSLSDDRLCFYTEDRQHGVCDRTGKIILPPKSEYTSIGPYTDGLASFRKELDGKIRWGFLDTLGQETIPAQYHLVLPFTGGMTAVARDSDDRFIYINKDNAPCFGQDCSFYCAFNFLTDLAQVKDEPNSLWRYIDREGKEVIPAKFKEASSFSRGLAIVRTEDDSLICINQKGKKVFQIAAKDSGNKVQCTKFCGPLIMCRESGENRYYYLNKRGRRVWEGKVSQQEASVLQTYFFTHL
ncbi:MAG: WG repeat-containing protein [Planctomycetia bacterium]|nr:WG repeat-containing protein [Planctomycetia bacterium]